MISCEPFWNTLRERGETTYSLINNHHISSATVNRLRKNLGISTLTINDLCRILHYRVEDILVEDILLYCEEEPLSCGFEKTKN